MVTYYNFWVKRRGKECYNDPQNINGSGMFIYDFVYTEHLNDILMINLN